MVKHSRVVWTAGEGDNVAVPVSAMDRGRGEPRNLLRVIIDVDDNGQYTIACSIWPNPWKFESLGQLPDGRGH